MNHPATTLNIVAPASRLRVRRASRSVALPLRRIRDARCNLLSLINL